DLGDGGSGGSGGTGGDGGIGGTGGTNTDAGGMGGTSGGSGGGPSGTTATTVSSSTGGSGGSGGTPSSCGVDRAFDATPTTGVYPAALMLGLNNSARAWDYSWVEADDVYIAARSNNASVLLERTLLDGTGTHSASAIATRGQYAYVTYGELAEGDARIVMTQVNPLDAASPLQDDTGGLASDTAPRVVGVTHRGSSSDMLVAALASDDSAILAL